MVSEDDDDDGRCPHGWPYEYCTICHEEGMEPDYPDERHADRG